MNTPLQSRTRLATLMGAMCSTSQCELRSTFPNLHVTNVIRIVTFYTLPPLESPISSWVTRSQRSRRRNKGLYIHTYIHTHKYLIIHRRFNLQNILSHSQPSVLSTWPNTSPERYRIRYSGYHRNVKHQM